MIFGTDGIRGAVGEHPMTAQTLEKLSGVLANWLPQNGLVVIGADPRASSNDVKNWITSRLGDHNVIDLGVVPTPVVAFETQARVADLGIMITASHNPAGDNGLKFFDREGLKIKYDLAKAWSAEVESSDSAAPANPAERHPVGAEHYIAFLDQVFDRNEFEGLKIGFDLAHGAGSHFVKGCLEHLGVDAVVIGDHPNGFNINQGIGALHPEALIEIVRDRGLIAGFALDGDGDRLIAVDADGEIPGDVAIYALKQQMIHEGRTIRAVVGTIMCGMGLEQTLRIEDIDLIRTPVGDQHVLSELVSRDLLLGGEPSGHLIQGDLFAAGDGFLAAMRLARGLRRDPFLFNRARTAVPMYPVFENAYRVRHKPPLDELPAITDHLANLKTALGGDGRLIVRYSGTEPKLRVYLEAETLDPYRDALAQLEALIQEHLA